MKSILFTSSLLLLTSLFAAPPKGPVYEPVAEGYCSWAGLTDANWRHGRDLCPSDLRHKLALVIFVKAEDFDKQIDGLVPIFRVYNTVLQKREIGLDDVPRDKISLIVVEGKSDPASIKKILQNHTSVLASMVVGVNVYAGVTGSKVPDNGGKYPFYCVFGPEPGDPIASGECDAGAVKKLVDLASDAKYVVSGWKPYYGTVAEPQFMKNFTKALKSGKPLTGLTASCKKGISSKNPEQAKECQILYDALEQTRSDYLFRAQGFASTFPIRADYEAQLLMKQWPQSKKKAQPCVDGVRAVPDMPTLCKIFTQFMTWRDENFKFKSAAEAKKNENVLQKMKATCDGIVEKSSSTRAQSMAAWLSTELEAFAPQMESKAPVK